MLKYIIVILISMVPFIDLRGAVPIATEGYGIHPILAVCICTLANMVPVPIIYFFARRFLIWGAEKRYIGKLCKYFLVKGERAGQKLVAKTGQKGLFVALLLFVGIPIPGTGAWTGTLGASFLDMGFKKTVLSVSLGVLMAGIIMAVATTGVFSIIGL